MSNPDERYSKLRRQKINVMLNEEERRIITEKAIKYGYGDCLAEYIRAACIYENIYIEDVEGKKEICEKVSNYIEVLKEILNKQRELLKVPFLNDNQLIKIRTQNEEIINQINSLSRLIIATLSVNTENRIQQRINMIEKHKSDKIILQRIKKIKNNLLILRPSNLSVPNESVQYIVFLKDYTKEFVLDNLDELYFSSTIDQYREVAMKKKLYTAYLKNGNSLKCGIVMSFDNFNVAKTFANEIAANEVINCLNEEVTKVGDSYTNNS